MLLAIDFICFADGGPELDTCSFMTCAKAATRAPSVSCKTVAAFLNLVHASQGCTSIDRVLTIQLRIRLFSIPSSCAVHWISAGQPKTSEPCPNPGAILVVEQPVVYKINKIGRILLRVNASLQEPVDDKCAIVRQSHYTYTLPSCQLFTQLELADFFSAYPQLILTTSRINVLIAAVRPPHNRHRRRRSRLSEKISSHNHQSREDGLRVKSIGMAIVLFIVFGLMYRWLC